MSNRRLTAYTFLLITAIIWGVAGPVIKFTLFEFPPLIFLSYRFLISAVVGIALLWWTKPTFPTNPGKAIATVTLGFLTSTVTLGLLFLGFAETTSLAGITISAMGPIFVALFGVLLLRERVTRLETFGMALAFLGTVVTVGEPVFAATPRVLETTIRGNFFVVLSLLIGVGVVLLEKVILKKGVSPSVITHTAFIVGACTTVPLMFLTYPIQEIVSTLTSASHGAHLGVWYMAILSGTIAYILHGRGLKAIEASEASLFSYLGPIFGVPLSLFWLGETVSAPFAIGCIIIALGVTIAEFKRKKRR